MWKTVLPGACGRWEPIELRVLKRSLANLNCVCKTCTRHSPEGSELYDVGVQASHSSVLDRFIQVTPKDSLTIRQNDFTQLKQQFCPSCYVTYNLLRSGAGVATRVFKDEEIETKFEKLTSNKSTEQLVSTAEKTTSVTNKPVLKFSNLSIFESSECSPAHSDRALWSPSPNSLSTKEKICKKSNREVTFLMNNCLQFGRELSPQDTDVLNPLRDTVTPSTSDVQVEDAYSKTISRYNEPYVGPKYRNCMCRADDLIRAIRSPFANDW